MGTQSAMILSYIERGWSYPSRKPLQGLFSKFSTSKNRFRNKSVRDLKVRFRINTYRYFRSGSTGSTGQRPVVPVVHFHVKLRLPPLATGSTSQRPVVPVVHIYAKPSRTDSTGDLGPIVPVVHTFSRRHNSLLRTPNWMFHICFLTISTGETQWWSLLYILTTS
jgi:hypothetical protein